MNTTPNHRVLLVEDDPNLGTLLAEYLTAKGFATDLRTDGEAGWNAYSSGGYDLLVLDVMMPLKDGFTLAREIRERDRDTPIVFLTARGMKEDTRRGFETGADDYLTKPFSMEELLLRIGAVLRRTKGGERRAEPPHEFRFGQCLFDHRRQTLTTPAGERKLTTKENELLRLLCLHKGGVLERSEALTTIWGGDNYFNARSMDVYIAKLRKYLRDDPGVGILNIHGKGFRLLEQEPQ
jgi:DNA-binding response OmpR family regulator